MIVTKRESTASLIHDTSPTLRHSLQQSHNKGMYYGFRDSVLSRLVTIIKALQCLQAYGFIRILYGIALENTEYGERDLIYGYSF